MRSTVLSVLTVVFITVGTSQTPDSSVAVRIVTDEADAVLSILAKEKSKQTITQEDWQQLFSSEGYVRLKKREASLQRTFTDEEFKSFVLADSVFAQMEILSETLAKWKGADINGAARKVLAYLPLGAQIRTKIYPVIKPRTNSFVFETMTDPAIFLYIDPEITREKFANTLAHELHHIGYAHSCGAKAAAESEDSAISKNIRTVLDWIGAFGEGFAMLAAAGGPDVHPHAVSPGSERARWDDDMKNFGEDLKKVDRFFLDILENKLKAEEIQKTAYSFFGIQGPWYTVGWKMAVTIEKSYGRPKLIECMCDPRELLVTYNRAALAVNRAGKESLALWSSSLIDRIGK